MRRFASAIGLVAVLLTACATPAEPSSEREFGTGAALDAEGTEPAEITEPEESAEEELLIEAEEVKTIPPLSEEESLRLAYQEAERVHALASEIVPTLDDDAQNQIYEALAIFQEDITSLKAYADNAAETPLPDDEKIEVINLMVRVEEGIAVFAQMIELLGAES